MFFQRKTKWIPDLINSFLENRSDKTELIVYISKHDPKFSDYTNYLLRNMNPYVSFIMDESRNMVEVLNYISTELCPNIPYYQEFNDDHIIRTKNWDSIMIDAIEKHNGWGVASGSTPNLPTATMISGNIVRALEHFFNPLFKHLFVDDWIREICEALNLYIYLPEVNIEHMHKFYSKAENDDTYNAVYAPEL